MGGIANLGEDSLESRLESFYRMEMSRMARARNASIVCDRDLGKAPEWPARNPVLARGITRS